MIEIYVVRDENLIVQQVENIVRHVFKWRGVLYHFIGDTSKCAYIDRNFPFGVNEGGIAFNYLFTVVDAYGYFGNAICAGMPPGSFNIHNVIHRCKCIKFLLTILVEKSEKSGKSEKSESLERKKKF